MLNLPPKFATYTRVDPVDVAAQVEKALAKLRWELAKPVELDENGEPKAEQREHFYDVSRHKFDFRVMRATEQPFNKSITLPKPAGLNDEIALQDLKNNLSKVTSEYVSKPRKATNNLTTEEKVGLRQLTNRVKTGEVVVFQTDKSSRFSVDSIDNYKLACQPHIRGDEAIPMKQYDCIEQHLSAHSVMWSRMLRMGTSLGHAERFKDNMISKYSPIAPMYGLRKDHKDLSEPPMRPVCGASSSNNRKLSFTLSTILSALWKHVSNKTCCMSTEEMAAEISRVNELNGSTPLIVGSMDVAALYPSLDIEFTIDKVCEVLSKSDLEIDGVDYEEVGLYLALNLTNEQINRSGLAGVCPTRRSRGGRAPTITTSGIAKDPRERFKSWIKPHQLTTAAQERSMLTEAMRVGLTLVMTNHTYEFDNTIYRQKKGGAIGLELTGTLAQVFMSWYDTQLVGALTSIGLRPYMFQRYVDDTNPAFPEAPMGSVYRDGTMQFDESQLAKDVNTPPDERTMRLVRDVGNAIHPSIRLEIDYPSNHPDGKCPC